MSDEQPIHVILASFLCRHTDLVQCEQSLIFAVYYFYFLCKWGKMHVLNASQSTVYSSALFCHLFKSQ